MAETEYRDMEPDEAKKRIDSGNAVLVDVRRKEEYEAIHIPHSVNIPNEQIGIKMPEELNDLNAEIILYCRTGRRAKEAEEKLKRIGYTNVRNAGGIVDWPYETESGAWEAPKQ